MKLDLNNLLKALWPGVVLVVWSVYLFGTAFLNVTVHVLAVCYLIMLPFIIGDIIRKDSEE